MGVDPERCKIQVGDISFIGGPGRRENKRDPLGHLHHNDGTCFDIRPFRVDSKHIGTTITYDIAGYSQSLTKKFIDHAIKLGAGPLYFEDPEMMKDNYSSELCDLEDSHTDENKGPLSCPGHSNHIHLCFNPEKVQGCN